MKATVLAKRYAKALFELAEEKNILETVAGEVHSFQKMLSESEELQHFFLSPEFGREGKVRLIEKNFQDQFSGLFINFLFILLKKRRQNLYNEIVAEFDQMYDRHHNRIRASAITAMPLGKDELEGLKKTLSAQYRANFEIENAVTPEILGGLILKIDGKVIDASLLNQLKKLKENLMIERN
ncbi:MAG: ATP synthase F1 subunit delta [Calditrichaeota bacterium]|nr:MAG: ATP synthase F1 subunit delta [Calditrichota bacterium]